MSNYDKKELEYLLDERLGMICEDREPTKQEYQEAINQIAKIIYRKIKCSNNTNSKTTQSS